MTDINNHNNGIGSNHIGRTEQSQKSVKKESKPAVKQSVNEEVLNLNNNPVNFLGKSMIKKSQKLTPSINPSMAANIEQDLDFLRNNKELVQKSDRMFDLAFAGTNDYEKAAKVQFGYANEFSN